MSKMSVTSAMLLVGLVTGPVAAQGPNAAQDRPFLFSISTPKTDTPHATAHLDTGFGEFDVAQGNQPELRLGIQASVGSGFTFLGRVGLASDQREVRSSQQGELLYSVIQAPAHHGSLAIGMGMRHESAGVNVLLGRVAAGRTFTAWRVDGNALLRSRSRLAAIRWT
jgi:hypothetical protein